MYDIFYLKINKENYFFNNKFPKNVIKFNNKRELLSSKLWYIKSKIRYKTDFTNPVELIDEKKYSEVIPKGLVIYPPLRNEYKKVHSELTHLYDNYKSYPFLNNYIADYTSTRGLFYIFTSFSDPIYYKESLNFLKKNNYKELSNIIEEYIQYFFIKYNIKKEKEEYILSKLQLGLLKYSKNDGIWLHIDNIKRYDQGPIATISIGPKYNFYDLAPSLINDPKIKPLRIKMDEGSLFIMDGSSRIEWSHGLPYNNPYNENIKYTITFKFDKFNEKKIGYNPILETNIFESSLYKNNKISNNISKIIGKK